MKNANKCFYNSQSSSIGGIKNSSTTIGSSSFINNSKSRCIRELDLESRIFFNSKLPRKESITEHMRKNDFIININKENKRIKERNKSNLKNNAFKYNQEEQNNNNNNREQELPEQEKYFSLTENNVDEQNMKNLSKKNNFMDHQLHSLLSNRYASCNASAISTRDDDGDTPGSTMSGIVIIELFSLNYEKFSLFNFK